MNTARSFFFAIKSYCILTAMDGVISAALTSKGEKVWTGLLILLNKSLRYMSATRLNGTPTAIAANGMTKAGMIVFSPASSRVRVSSTLDAGQGCQLHTTLCNRGLHVTGVDASPTLIALCRKRMPQQEWIMSDMRTVALHRHFDGILGWDSFFHLNHDDQRKMFEVFAAHAAPGAFLLFNTGPGQGEAMGEYKGEPLYHASLDAAEYQMLLDRSGFDMVAHAVEDPTAGGRTVWLAQFRRRSY